MTGIERNLLNDGGPITRKFLIVSDTTDSKGIFIIRASWLKSPTKADFFWPPTNNSKLLEQYLLYEPNADTTKWKSYRIHTIFAQDDRLGVAKKKLQKIEDSTTQSSEDDIGNNIVSINKNSSKSTLVKKKIPEVPMSIIKAMAYHQKARRLSSSPLIKSSDRSPNISAKRSLSNQLLDRSPSTTPTVKRSLFSNEIDRSQSTTPPAKRLSSSSNQTLAHSLNITYPPSKRSKTVLGSALSHSQPSLASKTLPLNDGTHSLQFSSDHPTPDRSPNISAKRSLSNQLLDRSLSTTPPAKRSLLSNEIDRSPSTTPPAKRFSSSSNQTLAHSLNITHPPTKRSKIILESACSHSQPSLAAKTLPLNRATRSLQLSSNRRTTDGSPNTAHSSSKRSRTILQPGFNKSHSLSSNRGTPDCYNANGNKRKSSSQEILVRESAPLICEDALPPLQTSLTSKSPTRFTQKTPPYRSSTPLSFNSEEITTNHQNEENIIEVNHNVHKSSLLPHHSKTPHDLAYSNEIYKQEESLLIMIAQSLKKQEKLHKQTNELLKALLVKNNNTSINDDECNYEEIEKFVISELKLPLKTKNEFVKANKILENEDIAQKFVCFIAHIKKNVKMKNIDKITKHVAAIIFHEKIIDEYSWKGVPGKKEPLWGTKIILLLKNALGIIEANKIEFENAIQKFLKNKMDQKRLRTQ